MRIRALTVGISVLHEDFMHGGIRISTKLTEITRQINHLANILQKEGYEVQTKRIALNSFEDWINPSSSIDDINLHMNILVRLLDTLHIDFCSLGGCKSIWALDLTPTLLSFSPKLSSSFRIQNPSTKYDPSISSIPSMDTFLKAAETVLILSKKHISGKANFNFCVSFNCPPNIPFFPASYHSSPTLSSTNRPIIESNIEESKSKLTIGLENGDLLFLAYHGVKEYQEAQNNLACTLIQTLQPIEELILKNIDRNSIEYGGIDASINPGLSMLDSVGAGIEQLFPNKFGALGTLATVMTTTNAIRSIEQVDGNHKGIKLTGYCGLMLPIMEDLILAARANENPPSFTLRDLMIYSSTCGVGLDMIPVAGNISTQDLAAIYLEMAVLSNKLHNKPLSARILPIPNKIENEMTDIDSEYLCNCKILPHK